MHILEKSYWLPNLINSKTAEITRLRELAMSIPSSNFEQEFVSGGPKVQCRHAELIDKIVDLEAEILEEINELVDCQKEARQIINSIEDPTERMVLQYYYLDRIEMADIAAEMGYSLRQLYRIKAKALSKVVT
jgi:DNA-directed RNA polymerase specialized sigma subunit